MPRTQKPAVGKAGTSKLVPLDDLRPFPGNAWRGDVDAIKASLLDLDQYRPIVVNVRKGTSLGGGTILAGNHTWQAHRQLLEEHKGAKRWARIRAFFVDVDDEQAKKINVADNRIPQKGEWDDGALAELLTSIAAGGEEALTVTGFDQPTLEGLVVEIPEPEPPEEFGKADPDEETEYCCPSCGYEWDGNPK